MITNILPSWARPKVENFLKDRTSPMDGAEKQSVSARDGAIHESIIHQITDELIRDDNGPKDLDPRVGFVQKSVFNTKLTEDYQYRQEGDSVELAYTFGEGHHARYLKSDKDSAIMVDLLQSGHAHNLAVAVDKHNPANSVLFAEDH